MVAFAPEADLVAGLDAEFVADFFRNDDLSLGPDTMSHTGQYNSRDRDPLPSRPLLEQGARCAHPTGGSSPPARPLQLAGTLDVEAVAGVLVHYLAPDDPRVARLLTLA